jgi:hypothetical protein
MAEHDNEAIPIAVALCRMRVVTRRVTSQTFLPTSSDRGVAIILVSYVMAN